MICESGDLGASSSLATSTSAIVAAELVDVPVSVDVAGGLDRGVAK